MEMNRFIKWFNEENKIDLVIKAAIAHLWFVTIHPFQDGNGRITRALTDMLLAQSDKSTQRFYSMSAQIRVERKEYYEILEKTQKGDLDISEWIKWFLSCLINALKATDNILTRVLLKADFWNRNSKTIINERQKIILNKLLDGFEGKLTSMKWVTVGLRNVGFFGWKVSPPILLLSKEKCVAPKPTLLKPTAVIVNRLIIIKMTAMTLKF
jgi:Fic family protein